MPGLVGSPKIVPVGTSSASIRTNPCGTAGLYTAGDCPVAVMERPATNAAPLVHRTNLETLITSPLRPRAGHRRLIQTVHVGPQSNPDRGPAERAIVHAPDDWFNIEAGPNLI